MSIESSFQNPLLFNYGNHTGWCTVSIVPAGIAEGREDSSQSVAKPGVNFIASYFKRESRLLYNLKLKVNWWHESSLLI